VAVITPDQTEIERVIAESIVADPPLVAQPDTSLDPRVQKGAEWLDRTIPGWADLINLKSFKISSSVCCVLGQIGKKQKIGDRYEETAEKLFGPGSCYGGRAKALGFYIEPVYDTQSRIINSGWEPLQESWERAIAARQTR